MKLQTIIPLSPEKNQIDYTSKVLLLGSCFTENIGGKLDYFKFQNLQNPFGIVFHPLAIQNLVQRAVTNEKFTEADVFERDGQWFSFETHSSVTATSKKDLVVVLNAKLKEFSAYLSEASHIIFTFGTAWVYRHIASDAVVANCHKVPQQNFEKELLSVAKISASIEKTVLLISEINPSAISLITVSPVRHIKDGFIENGRSKAHLIAGIHQFIHPQSKIHHQKSYYFPSYELMMDELRDYRFYAEDMLHPNATAIQYIWEKFKLVWIASETEPLQKEIDTIQRGLQHRAFDPKSASYKKFRTDLDNKIRSLEKKLPTIIF
ncbi:GSCFA domain-containing protein [Rasiella sp. SM2506]|uniref:GSCFA domain-containing protein n=1 Tax=Rasiella sp. SM2506 TaxID=3423914 RepID=UPI003D7BABCE